ncbi:MAG: hypothetical protein AAF467_11025 [Actinomycetota bacterium]
MELTFVISALRRRFWIVTLFAIFGAIPGLLVPAPTGAEFQTTAVLLVQPPTRATPSFSPPNADRYVASQLEVLRSPRLAQAVADQVNIALGVALDGPSVAERTEIEPLPETDIVEITVTADSDRLAQTTAQTYAAIYVASLATSDEDAEQIVRLEQQVQTLTNRLTALDERLRTAMVEFLPDRNDLTPEPIPATEVVDPSAVSQRQLVLAELLQLQAELNELRLDSRLRVNSRIIADAELPIEANRPAGDFLLAGGLLSGLLIGVVVAVMWARFSAKVLDRTIAEEILGAPLVSELAYHRSLGRDSLAAFLALPRTAVGTIDQLCVRAEALSPIGEPLVVAVTGTMRNAGSTTLALAMAERFAAGGASVVLIDGDVRDPRVTSLFNGAAEGGVPTVVGSGGNLVDAEGRSALTRTMDPAVRVLGLGANRGLTALRRDTVQTVIDAARSVADVAVVDAGPVLDLASTLQFAASCDAVVLAVPLTRQKADPLSDVARQLHQVRSKLLPVVTAPGRRPRRDDVVAVDGSISSSASEPSASSASATGVTSPGADEPTKVPARNTVIDLDAPAAPRPGRLGERPVPEGSEGSESGGPGGSSQGRTGVGESV